MGSIDLVKLKTVGCLPHTISFVKCVLNESFDELSIGVNPISTITQFNEVETPQVAKAIVHTHIGGVVSVGDIKYTLEVDLTAISPKIIIRDSNENLVSNIAKSNQLPEAFLDFNKSQMRSIICKRLVEGAELSEYRIYKFSHKLHLSNFARYKQITLILDNPNPGDIHNPIVVIISRNGGIQVLNKFGEVHMDSQIIAKHFTNEIDEILLKDLFSNNRKFALSILKSLFSLNKRHCKVLFK